jgi:hypothetical protein
VRSLISAVDAENPSPDVACRNAARNSKKSPSVQALYALHTASVSLLLDRRSAIQICTLFSSAGIVLWKSSLSCAMMNLFVFEVSWKKRSIMMI